MAVSLSREQWEDFDKTRMRLAVEELLSSENGRFFLMSLFNAFGYNAVPFSPEPHQTSFLVGRLSCAKDLEATLITHQPFAMTVLLNAAAEEAQIRKTDDAE